MLQHHAPDTPRPPSTPSDTPSSCGPQALEFQAQQRLWALQQEELAAAGTSALRDAATTQASALAAQLQRRATEWQAQDEARGLKQQHELARKARLAAAAEQEAALQAAKGMLLAQELQAQEELAKVGWLVGWLVHPQWWTGEGARVYHVVLLRALMPDDYSQDMHSAYTCKRPTLCCAVTVYHAPTHTTHTQVEHQRRLRQLAEDEAQLTAQQLQLQAERQAVAAAAGREAIQQQAQAQTTRWVGREGGREHLQHRV